MFYTVRVMENDIDADRPLLAQTYRALRQIGTCPGRVRQELGLDDRRAARLEALFGARAFQSGDSQTPKFARHERHAAAALAAGGFWALSERRVGGGGSVVCLPMIAPAADLQRGVEGEDQR